MRQYIIAKDKEAKRKTREWDTERFLERINRIKEIPQSEWSIEDAAAIKAFEEGEFWKNVDSEAYIYEDDFNRDRHFSMLRKFQDTRITAAAVSAQKVEISIIPNLIINDPKEGEKDKCQ